MLEQAVPFLGAVLGSAESDLASFATSLFGFLWNLFIGRQCLGMEEGDIILFQLKIQILEPTKASCFTGLLVLFLIDR